MALRPPGGASKIALLVSSIWTISMIFALIAGHLVLVIFIFLHFDQDAGIQVLVEKTGLPMALLWSLVVASLLLDVWIFKSDRKNKENIRRR
ncbi:MAG: hypothetical protein Q9M15_02365 [Mariprofundaceae bacterium]|nr:hypothetical protein [Mariprofundaceae bacterium]